MFTLPSELRDSLQHRLGTPLAHCSDSPLDLLARIIPDSVKDPEHHKAMQRSLEATTNGDEISFDTYRYRGLDDKHYETLFAGVTQLTKLLKGAGVNESNTLLVADRLERTVAILGRMAKEDAQNLAEIAPQVNERSAAKIAREVHTSQVHAPPLESLGERHFENEVKAQTEIQLNSFNSILDRLDTFRTAINAIREVQANLRSHRESQDKSQAR